MGQTATFRLDVGHETPIVPLTMMNFTAAACCCCCGAAMVPCGEVNA